MPTLTLYLSCSDSNAIRARLAAWAPLTVIFQSSKAFWRGAAAWAAVLQLPGACTSSRPAHELVSGIIFRIVSTVSAPVEGAALLGGVGVAAALVAGAADDGGAGAEAGASVAAGACEFAAEEVVTTGAAGDPGLTTVGVDVEPSGMVTVNIMYMMRSTTHGRGEQGATPSRATTTLFVASLKNGAARDVPARSRTVERVLIEGIAFVRLLSYPLWTLIGMVGLDIGMWLESRECY